MRRERITRDWWLHSGVAATVQICVTATLTHLSLTLTKA